MSVFNEDSIVKLYCQTKVARDIGLMLCRNALWDYFAAIFLLLLETLRRLRGLDFLNTR